MHHLYGGSEIMSLQPFVLRPDQHEPALNVVGTQVTVLASNASTQSYGITLQQGEEGSGPTEVRMSCSAACLDTVWFCQRITPNIVSP